MSQKRDCSYILTALAETRPPARHCLEGRTGPIEEDKEQARAVALTKKCSKGSAAAAVMLQKRWQSFRNNFCPFCIHRGLELWLIQEIKECVSAMIFEIKIHPMPHLGKIPTNWSQSQSQMSPFAKNFSAAAAGLVDSLLHAGARFTNF
jgi:hypothetical protein